MPRESSHWEIVEESIKRVISSCKRETKTILESNTSIILLGAIAPDVPYYYRYGKARVEEVAEKIHGNAGNDPSLFINALITEMSKVNAEQGKVLIAFIIGLVSHVRVDKIFHPLICYLSGNYFAEDIVQKKEARTKHRLIGSAINKWSECNFSSKERQDLKKILKISENNLPLLCSVLSNVTHFSNWHLGFKDMANAQSLFQSRMLSFLINSADRVAKRRFSDIAAMFYPSYEISLDFYNTSLRYRNPVSGEEFSKSLKELREEAINENIQFLTELSDLLAKPELSLNGLIATHCATSLLFNIPGSKASEAKYFASYTLPELKKLLRLSPKKKLSSFYTQ